ncbi:ankyrin repeat protein, putative [Trichomonas vaginalis G3]|uniref:Ankyrin repeat protein, putative n=1 Tax=Trichomonas vaginalis (strain ATCC PRA-98 / G3) TaxID=412133 RepID=A2DZ30_TRIV3|nr:spectrin binding [Trichomonas vaginalis G3]EAY14306.1 ankyrin repeat protein, putative [Trichomonas vaginalis G3]KAI5517333.1 spectrin binding [Trichomonas vaginalis G3]|eukprot:XP_001326529.1 ankyrin repeat protein [Trichomonas vaginalis G3]
MIKTELIDSKKHFPQHIVNSILCIIPYNNRYAKSFLSLAKFLCDDYQITKVRGIPTISNYIFYKEYGIKLYKSDDFEKIKLEKLDIHTENTIYRAIMYNDLKEFIIFTERDGFDKNQKLKSQLYPYSSDGYSLLELCCYHGAVDCFKLLRTKFSSEITQICLQLSFLGGNPEIMSECLKYKTPNENCMISAIISHNIDFVSFLMNEYNLEIDLDYCAQYNNLETFLVHFDKNNYIDKCLINSVVFNIPSLCEYFILHGANIHHHNYFGLTSLHFAACNNCYEIAKLLLSHGANAKEKNYEGVTPLHSATVNDSKEIAELLLSYGANVSERKYSGGTPLHSAAYNNSKEVAEVLLSHGAYVNEKDKRGQTALHHAASNNSKETAQVLLLHGANINEKDIYGKTSLHIATENNNNEIVEFLLSHGANINEKDKS